MLAQMKLAVAAALLFGTTSAVLAKGRSNPGGGVRPCSLAGVNPVYHPQIFGNAATAREFGFVQGPDHTWHVDQGLCGSLQHRTG
jgi:hypothetical protein